MEGAPKGGSVNRSIPYAVIAWVCCACAAPEGAGSADPLDPEVVPRISLRELARVGGYDSRPEYTLANVDYAALLNDGSVAIATLLEVRVFSEQGVFLRALGRSGGGPGTPAASKRASNVRWEPLRTSATTAQMAMDNGTFDILDDLLCVSCSTTPPAAGSLRRGSIGLKTDRVRVKAAVCSTDQAPASEGVLHAPSNTPQKA